MGRSLARATEKALKVASRRKEGPVSDIEVKNAVIEGTKIDMGDRGILTAWVHLKYSGGGQGLGGYVLDTCGPAPDYKRLPTILCGVFVMGILEAVGAPSWEALKGMPCRVRAEHSGVHAIGHHLDEKWFTPKEAFAPYVDGLCGGAERNPDD